MLHMSPTQYSSLPSMPTINAMPSGIPQGPWGPLYRSAPGAQIPATVYPGMMGALGSPVQILGADEPMTKGQMAKAVVVGSAMSAAVGASFAAAVGSANPVRNGALVLGGISLASGLLAVLLKKDEAAVAA